MNFINAQITKKAGPVGAGSGFASVTSQASNATKEYYYQCEGMCKPKALSFSTPTDRITIASREDSLTSQPVVPSRNKCITVLQMHSLVYWLGSQIHRLRYDYGRAIETLGEPGGVDLHGQYVLQTPCQVDGIGDGA